MRLPGEASPAKEAKDGQHNNDDDDDPKNRHVILSLGACRLYGEPTRICKVRGQCREWYGSRSGESRGERGEDAEISVEGDSILPAQPEGLYLTAVTSPNPPATVDEANRTNHNGDPYICQLYSYKNGPGEYTGRLHDNSK